MREHKYRAWDTVKKVMYSAYELGQDQEALLPDGRGFANISSTSTRLTQIHRHLLPLEYTGLKDKNDKEIYEGDIVQLWAYDDTQKPLYICEIKFTLEHGGYCISTPYTDDHFFDMTAKQCEVIGNIYENKELLEEK